MKNIPTYEQCEEICRQNTAFRRKEEVIDGYKVVQYTYFLAQFTDFDRPFKDCAVKAFELRGLTFIQQDDGTWERNLMLHKFFNLNQTEGYQLQDVQDKKIIRVQDKKDGSLIRFVRLPNGSILAKTKFSFQSDQAVAAQRMYDSDPSLAAFVDATLDRNLAAMFEYVSPLNRIVLAYSRSDLILLQLRDEKTGEYVNDLVSHKLVRRYNVRFSTEQETLPLNEYIKLAETLEDVEGWVIQFDDGQTIKIKTAWYFAKHRLLTEDVNRENIIVEYVLNDDIDDVIAQIPTVNVEEREHVEEIARLVSKYVNKTADYVYNIVVAYEKKLLKEMKDWRKSRKDFVMSHRDNRYFSILMKLFERNSFENALTLVKADVTKQTKSLEAARAFIEELKETT